MFSLQPPPEGLPGNKRFLLHPDSFVSPFNKLLATGETSLFCFSLWIIGGMFEWLGTLSNCIPLEETTNNIHIIPKCNHTLLSCWAFSSKLPGEPSLRLVSWRGATRLQFNIDHQQTNSSESAPFISLLAWISKHSEASQVLVSYWPFPGFN